MDTGYLTTQVSTIVGQLHGLFDEIGVPNHEREARELEVSGSFLDITNVLILSTVVYRSLRNIAQSSSYSYYVSCTPKSASTCSLD